MKKFCLLLTLSLLFLPVFASLPVRFAMLSDLHVAPGNTNARALSAVLEDIRRQSPHFIVITGDLTETGSDQEIEEVSGILAKYTIPVYILPGGNETVWSESSGKTFAKYWKADRFHFMINDLNICGINTGPYTRMNEGFVRNEDMKWLEQQLETPDARGKKVLFFSHYPLLAGVGNRTKMLDLLRKYAVMGAFCGQENRFHLYNMDTIPMVVCNAMIAPGGEAGFTMVSVADGRINCEYFETGTSAPLRNIFVDTNNAGWTSYADDESTGEKPGMLPLNMAADKLSSEVASIFTGLAVNSGCFVYGTSSGDLICRDELDGSVRWSKSFLSPLLSTPMISDGKVIVGLPNSRIASFDLKTGDTKWVVKTKAPLLSDGIIRDGYLYIGSGKGEFLKVDVSDGTVAWRFERIVANGRLQGIPSVSGDRVIFGAWDTNLYCLDRKSGVLCWTWSNPGANKSSCSSANVIPVIADSMVLIATPDCYMTALNLDDGREIWRTNRYKVRESITYSSILRKAFAKTIDGELLSFPFPSGEFSGETLSPLHIGYEHNPCPGIESGRIVYSGSRCGEIIATAAGFNCFLWKYKCGDSTVNQIVTDVRGNIWVVLSEGIVWRFSMK